ncbi:Siderophore iron transporter 3 [Rhizoctonia solani AG-1 IB]|uniref:Siderophore iron transporter 3 n=1 Tax=Thanatephorus cucumeris (strain AG1-IB / isolate 7/3/14) TaxID=1108050 RepID=M5BJ59_THACB|nr:Siderophore iron transporter 3 [Rhizoctonia solani AG-1 IB]
MNTHDRSSVSSDNDQKVDAGPVTHQLPEEPSRAHVVNSDVERNPGVARVEALHRHLGGLWRWTLYISIGALAYIYSLDQNTTSNYLPLATSSFGQHAFIGTIGTAEGIITAVGKPCIAKIADLFSRPTAYIVVLIFYVVGYILVASAQSVYAIAGGMVLYTVGHTGLDLVTDIIIADITPLKWRGFATALPSAPFILNAFISAEIVTGVTNGPGWRWGYGMFAIIVPAIMVPAIITLFTADKRAKKNGELTFGASRNERRRVEKADENIAPRQPLWVQFKDVAIKMDLFGLVLIGFIFGLILFPISLAKTVRGGWSNRE